MQDNTSSAFGQSAFRQSAFSGAKMPNTEQTGSGWYESFRQYESEPSLESPGFMGYMEKLASGELEKLTDSPLSFAGDNLLAVPRGIVDAGMGLYDLADWATADMLPDWEKNPLGASNTVTGSLIQGIANFAVGFVPVVGWLGKAGQVARLGKAGQFIASSGRAGSMVRAAAAGAVADFTVFRADQERLSNLMTQVDNPIFNNAVTQYLAADGDDGEIEGRFKNAVEGLGIGLVMDSLVAGMRAIKKSKQKIESGGTIEEALTEREKALQGARILEMAGVVDSAGRQVDEAATARPVAEDPAASTVANLEDTSPPAQQLDEVLGVQKDDPEIGAAVQIERDQIDNMLVSGGTKVKTGTQGMIERINREVSHGKLSAEDGQFAVALLGRMGNALERTGLRFRNLNVLGRFEFVQDVITITRKAIEGGSFQRTFVHEMWHALERYLTPAQVKMINRDFTKARARMEKQFPGRTARQAASDVAAAGGDPADMYRFTDVAEWMAENLTDATLARLDLEEGTKTIMGFMRYLMKNLVTEVKARFGVITYDKIAKDWLEGRGKSIKKGAAPEGMSRTLSYLDEADMKDPRSTAASIDAPKPKQSDIDNFEQGKFINSDSRLESERLAPKENLGWYDATPQGLARVSKLVEAIDSGALSRANLTIDEAIKKLGLNKSWFGKRYLRDGIPDPSESRDAALVLAEAMDNVFGDAPKPAVVAWNDTLYSALYDMQRMLGLDNIGTAKVVQNLMDRQIDIRHWLTAAKHVEHMRAATIAQKARDFEALMKQAEIQEQAGNAAAAATTRAEALKASKTLIVNALGIEQFVRANAALSSEVGRTLNILRMSPEQARARLGQLSDEYMKNGLLGKRLDAMKPDELMGELQRLNLVGEFGPHALRSYMDAYKGAGNFWRMPYEVWINSILSGPKTLVVNMSGLLNAVSRPMERGIGQLLSGKPAEAKESFRLAVAWTSKWQESLAVARQAWREERPMLTNSSFTDEWSPGAIKSSSESPMGAAINTFGRLIRTPTRAMLFTDEFIKQMTARAKVDEMLQAKGLKLVELGAMSADDMPRWMDDEIKRMMYDNGRLYSEKAVRDAGIISARDRGYKPTDPLFGQHVREYVQRNFDPSRGAIADEARRYATEITWQTDLDGKGAIEKLGRGVQSLTRDLPMLKMVFPFVRTPANLMIWLKDRSPVGSVKMYRDFMSGDPVRKADALGRLSVASGLWLSAYFAAANGTLTGRGPKDPREKRLLMDTGWQPYSVKFGDKYVSYHRLEPFSFVFGIVADLFDSTDALENDPTVENQSERVLGAALSAIANSVTEKTFFAGLSMWVDAFSGDANQWERLGRNYAASLVPNALSTFVPVADDELKQARSVLDSIMAKVPGLSDEVEPHRNLFGEVIRRPRGYSFTGALDPANPYTWTQSTKDPVRLELANLRYGFAPPVHTKDGVDLRDIRSRSGQSAYDRLQELTGQVKIGGQSLHSSLKKLIGSSVYKRMSDQSFEDFDSPRVQEIKRVVGRYRKQAQAQLLREFPELNTQFAKVRENKYRLKLGLAPQ